MTTNKNQRTTHIDDVVKYQPMPFFAAHCAICDFFYNYLCMHFIFTDENDEITHTYALVIAHAHTLNSLGVAIQMLCVSLGSCLLPFLHRLLLNIQTRMYLFIIFFSVLATFYFILLFRLCKIMCRAKNVQNERTVRTYHMQANQ